MHNDIDNVKFDEYADISAEEHVEVGNGKEFSSNRMEAAVPVTADIGSAVSQINDSPLLLNQDGLAR